MRLNRQIQWGLVLLIALISAISRLKFNGLILNFDYGIYQPDGSHYAYRALTFLGVDSNVAAERVVNWYQIHGIKNNVFPPSFLKPENVDTWGVTAPRVLYSILSMPFVYLFGLSGMLVIPILSFLLLVSCVFRLSEIYMKQWVGFLLVLILCTSPTVLRWMIANITDSLVTGLFGVVVLILTRDISQRIWIFSICNLIILTSLTRFCLPIWIAIAAVLWVQRKRTQSLWIFAISTVAFLPTFLYMPSTVILPADGEVSGLVKLFLLVKSFYKVGFYEIAQLAALDRALLLTIIVAVAISLRYFRETASQFFLAVCIAVWFIGAINGTVGVNFRYQLPVLVFACWVILSNSTKFTDWFGGQNTNLEIGMVKKRKDPKGGVILSGQSSLQDLNPKTTD